MRPISTWYRSAWCCAFLLFSYPILSTAQHSITGLLTDEANQPMEYANVLLLAAGDSSLVMGNVSKTDGSFRIEPVEAGDYLLSVSMIGYTDYYSSLFQLKGQEGTYALPTIQLVENAAQLAEVQVVEKRALFEQKIDRMVVNVDNSITAAGSTALEVLKRSPGVMVNPQTNSISMSGKDGVVVMMNGKISRMPMDALIQMLAGMNADDIEKIELIHTPPADFDAEGNAGFINIVMKKNQSEGFNGNFGLNAGYGMREKTGANLNFNYRKKKANLYGGYSWNYNYNPQDFRNYRGFVFEGDLIENIGRSVRDPTRTHVQNARLGLDLNLSDKTVVGGLVSWMDRHWTMDALNDVQVRENGELVRRINIPNDELNHAYNVLGNVNLQHQINKEQKINFDVDYAYFFSRNPSNYVNSFFDSKDRLVEETGLRVDRNTPMHIWVGKFDYTRNFGEKVILEMGLKGTSTSFDNDILVEESVEKDQWVKADLFSSRAMMNEKIGAVYSAVSWKFSDRLDFKAGLRYEYTDSNLGTEEEANIVDRQYHRLFPSVYLTNKLDEKNTLQFSYSRRINRPSFRQLAPFFIFFDPNTVGTGNPALQPSTSDALRFTYIWNTVNLSLEYSYTDEFIGRFQPEVDVATNTQINGAKNFIDAHFASINLSFPWQIKEWWSLRSNWTAGWGKFNDKIEGEPLSIERANWGMNATSSFTLPKDFGIELSGFYYGRSAYGTIIGQPIYIVDFGVQKQLKNDQGTLRFSVSDIFISGNFTSRVDDPNINFQYEGTFGQAERVFRLSYSRSFGNSKVKGARDRETGSAEEQRRAN